MPNFFIVFTVQVFKEHCFVAFVDLWLTDDLFTGFKQTLHSILLVHDWPIGKQSHSLAAPELQQNVRIRHK